MEEKVQCYHCGEESLSEEEKDECLCQECQQGIVERLKNFEFEQI